MQWTDLLTLRTYLSTAGDFVKLGLTTKYPFVAGGASGAPVGWTLWSGSQPITHVAASVTNTGIAMLSHVPGQPLPVGSSYNFIRSFPVTAGRRYVFRFRVKTQDQPRTYQPWRINLVTSPGGVTINTVSRSSQSDWEEVALWTDPIAAGITGVQVQLGVEIRTGATVADDDNWGVQFASFSMTEQNATYPDPTWREITRDIKSCSVAHGRSTRLNRYEVAAVTLDLKNDDGRYSFQQPHPFGFRPGRFIKATIGQVAARFIFPGIAGNYLEIDDKPGLRLPTLDIILMIPSDNPWTAQGVFISKYGGSPNNSWRLQAPASPSRVLQLNVSTNGFSNNGYTAPSSAPADAVWFRAVFDPLGSHTMSFYHAPESADPPLTGWRLWGSTATVTNDPAFANTAPVQIGQSTNIQPPMGGRLPYVMVRPVGGEPAVFVAEEGVPWDQTDKGTFIDYAGNTVKEILTSGQNIVQTVDLSAYPVFYGIIDRLKDDYDFEGRAVTSVEIRDVSTLLANSTVPTASTSEVFSGNRFNILLTAAQWHPTMRVIDPGQFVQQQILANGRTIRDELGLIADSEGAFFFADRSGNIVYRDRSWPDTDPAQTTVQAELLAVPYTGTALPIVDNVPTQPGAPIICLRELEPDWSRDRIINSLELANQGGTSRLFTDVISMQRYGPFEYQRMDFLNSNQHPEYITQRADDIMAGYTEPVLRINSVTFRVVDQASAIYAATVFLNQLVRVRYVNYRSQWGYAICTHVQAVAHAFNLKDWSVVLTLDQPISFVSFQLLDDAGWDFEVWDEGIWDEVET